MDWKWEVKSAPKYPGIAQKCPEVHKVPKNCPEMQKLSKIAQTAQNCPKEPKSVHSVQNCPEVPKLNNFYQEFSFGTPNVCTVVSYDYDFSLIHRVIRATLWFHD